MMSRKTKSRLFVVGMIACLAISFGTLGWLLVTTFIDGIPALTKQLFTDPPSTVPEEAGARPAILATIYLAALLLLMAVPIGVLTAIYLEEYAHKERWYNRLLELNIQNLAAVPAIVYGILGLAFVVRGPVGIGRVLLAGGIILTLVVLPTVIIASREAIRAVPAFDPARAASLWARRSGRWSRARCFRPRYRGSRPARSWRSPARSGRPRRSF